MIPEIIARQACTHSPWKFQNWRIENFEECSWMFFFSIWQAILGNSRAKECYVVSFQVRIFQWPLPQISSDNQVCHESNVLTGYHKSIFYKLIIYCYTSSDNILSIWILVTLFSSCVIVCTHSSGVYSTLDFIRLCRVFSFLFRLWPRCIANATMKLVHLMTQDTLLECLKK